MNNLIRPFAAVLAAAAVAMATSPGSRAAAQAPPCTPTGGLNFLCGVRNAEDLVPIPGTRWLIASGMDAGSGLHLIDTRAKQATDFPARASRQDRTRYAACPSPLDPKLAVLHGLSLRPAANNHFTLYATNHGGRESIEAFDVDATNARPSATWIGCVVLPPMLSANSVAAFRDGTLVATVLTTPGKTFEDLFAGRNTGIVLQWKPGANAFTPLPGTELAGNNGIETSPDDREFFVAASGTKRIVAYSRADPSKPLRVAQLKEFAPDNVRLVGNRLITAGMLDAEPACGGAPRKPDDIQCPRGWVADAVDPQTMAITEIARGPRAAPYTGTATAIPVGNELWLSSFNSDRIAYRTLSR